ncbi:hypothetical protein [Lacipirellula sp.]|uniref:hypothetical protein n=1 Tax=Lacipirellula sp. TaxID=2691419 RepID=UPI003D0CA8E5
MPTKFSGYIWALLICVIAAGCSRSGTTSTGSDNQLRAAMKLLGMEYGAYLASSGKAPTDAATLKTFLQSRMGQLQDFGVKSVDDLLPAGRDGQPLQIVYREISRPAENPNYAWVACEAIGSEGVRLACDSRGGVHEINEEQFSQAFSR